MIYKERAYVRAHHELKYVVITRILRSKTIDLIIS